MQISDILEERNKTHGNFTDQAATAQGMKTLMRSTPNWNEFTSGQKEAIEMMCTKMSRLGHGDPNHADSWIDIEGYSDLGKQEICDS